jgi:hypothetical protein
LPQGEINAAHLALPEKESQLSAELTLRLLALSKRGVFPVSAKGAVQL